jgi:uncharacterized membrane protein
MNEEETAVRNWLEAVEAPPPRMDLAEIVQIGRARARRRRQLAAGGSAAVALAVAAAVPAAVRVWPHSPDPYLAADRYPALDCTVTELLVPDQETDPSPAGVVAMDPTGRYLVGTRMEVEYENLSTDPEEGVVGSMAASPGSAILWDDGEPMELPVLRGTAWPMDVNSDGLVVGTGEDADQVPYGWAYHQGDLTELTAPPGYEFFDVDAVNEAGDIVGTVGPEDDDSRPVGMVAVWPAGQWDEPYVIPGTDVSSVADITDAGVVVGNRFDESESGLTFQPYLWNPDGTVRYLRLPEGATSGEVSAVRGAWAVGYADLRVPADTAEEPAGYVEVSGAPATGAPTDGLVTVAMPVRWDVMTGDVEVLDPNGGRDRSNAYARGVSANGDVMLSFGSPLVYRDGEWFSVPSPAEGYLDLSAIDDSGTVIAGDLTRDPVPGAGPYRSPVVWHC